MRLWLTIVIDDEPTADKNSFKPKPLPNLDCNIICGDSLIDEFEGVALIKHSKVLNNVANGQISLLQEEIDSRIAALIHVQKNLFHESDHSRKEEYRRYIRDIYDGIILEQLGKNSAQAKRYKLAAQQKSLPFILWQLKFINTGGIDKYKSYHGINCIRYLKDKYLSPIVKISDLKNMSEKRLKESLSEKIIIGGMNTVLECFYDSGEYLAGKSTTIIHDNPHLKFITAILNSKLMSFYYQKMFGSMSLAGGFYRIGVPQIKVLTIEIPKNPATIKKVEAKVDELQNLYSLRAEELLMSEIFAELDEEIYQIYGLNDAEINFIKNFELNSGKRCGQ